MGEATASRNAFPTTGFRLSIGKRQMDANARRRLLLVRSEHVVDVEGDSCVHAKGAASGTGVAAQKQESPGV